jgi:hypothetical protein
MDKRLLIRLVFILTLILPFIANGQSNDYKTRKCFGYQRDSCPTSSNMYYKVHEESRSALFVLGQTSRTKFTIFNGRDYRISMCFDPILGSQIGLKLLDSDTGNTLYDNKQDNFATEFEFTATQSREIIIEISVPGKSSLSDSDGNEDIIFVRKDTEMGCVGVLIEHMITPSKGF